MNFVSGAEIAGIIIYKQCTARLDPVAAVAMGDYDYDLLQNIHDTATLHFRLLSPTLYSHIAFLQFPSLLERGGHFHFSKLERHQGTVL